MKKIVLLTLSLLTVFVIDIQAQTFKVITVVESIVPGGVGRSRIIEENTPMDVENFTTERTDGKDSKQSEVKRKDAKVDSFEETKLLNFYSIAGINFQNIASNDAIITSKLNQMSDEGWDLAFVTSGVESSSGADDGNGIFITRFVFKK